MAFEGRCTVRVCPDGDDFNDICAAVAADVATIYADARLTRAMLSYLSDLCPFEEVIRVVGGFDMRAGVFVHGDGGCALSCLGPSDIELFTFAYLQEVTGARALRTQRHLRLVSSQREVTR